MDFMPFEAMPDVLLGAARPSFTPRKKRAAAAAPAAFDPFGLGVDMNAWGPSTGAPAVVDPYGVGGGAYGNPFAPPDVQPTPEFFPELGMEAPALEPQLPELEPDEPGWLETIGDILDRPRNAFHGLLTGRTDPLLGLIPFSETLGLYDPDKNRVTGADVNRSLFGIEHDAEKDGLLSASGAAGLATELIGDPLNLLPGFFGLKALTKGGRAAKLAGQHVSEAEKALQAFTRSQKAYNAKRAMMLEQGLEFTEAAPELAGMAQTFQKGGRRGVIEALTGQGGALGESANFLLEEAGKRGDDVLSYADDAADRVARGQEALFSVGGEFDPLGILRLGGGYNPLNYAPKIPGLTAPISLPQKTLIEGAQGAQAIQDLGRGIAELPGIKQAKSLFQRAPANVGARAGQKIVEAMDEAEAFRAGKTQAELEQAQALQEQLLGLKAGPKPAPAVDPLRDTDDIEEAIRAAERAEVVGDELVDPLTGEVLGPAVISRPDPVLNLKPLNPFNADALKRSANDPVWDAAQGLSEDGPNPLDFVGPHTSKDNELLSRQALKDVRRGERWAEKLLGGAEKKMADELDTARGIQAGRYKPAPIAEQFGAGVPGYKPDVVKAPPVEPQIESFYTPQVGNAVEFWNKKAYGGAKGRAKLLRGKVVAFNDSNNSFTVEASDGGQYAVPAKDVSRLNKFINKDYQKALQKYRRETESMMMQEVPRELRPDVKERAQDTRNVFAMAHDIPLGESMEANVAAARRRAKDMEALGLDPKNPVDVANALPKALERALAKADPEFPPTLRTVEFEDGERLGIGDELSLGGDTFRVKDATPDGKIKLKDGVEIEVPFSMVPKDRGTPILRAPEPDVSQLDFDPMTGEKLAPAVKPLDHGELNIPGRTQNIDADLDRYKKEQAAEKKASGKASRAEFNAQKATAKEAYAQHGAAMLEKYGPKMGRKEVKAMLDSWVKWEPKKFNDFLERYLKETGGAPVPTKAKLNKAIDVLADVEQRVGVAPVDMPRDVQTPATPFKSADGNITIQQRSQPERRATTTVHSYDVKVGDQPLVVSLFIKPDGTAIPNITGPGAGSIGLRNVMALRDEFLRLHPEIKAMEGQRAGSTGGKMGREVTVKTRTPEAPKVTGATPKIADPFEVPGGEAPRGIVEPPAGMIPDVPDVPPMPKAGPSAPLGAGKQTEGVEAGLNPGAPGAPRRMSQASRDYEKHLTERIAQGDKEFRATPAGPKQQDKAVRLRELEQIRDKIRSRIRVEDYLEEAGVGTRAAAGAAADMDPQLAKRITDALEHGGDEAPEIARVVEAVQGSYEQMLEEAAGAGLPAERLKSGRNLQYTTHVSTKAGHAYFQRLGKNKQLQAKVFVSLEQARQAKGIAKNPEALKPIHEQRAGRIGSQPDGMQRADIPRQYDQEALKELHRLDPKDKEFILSNNLQDEFQRYSKAISTFNPSQISRLPAYRELGVTELNEVFKKFGAGGPVFNENPAAQLFAAKARHVRSMAGKHFFDKIADDLGKATNGQIKAGGVLDGGLVQHTDGTIGVQQLNDMRASQGLPPVGFDDKETAAAVAQTFKQINDPEQVTGALAWFDSTTRLFKSWITRGFPAYHMRNHWSNRLQSWMAGVPTAGEHYDLANKIVAGKEATARIGNQTFTRQQLLNEARDAGATKGGWFEELARDSLDPTTKKRSFNPLEPDNVYVQTGEKFGAALTGAPGMLKAGAAGRLGEMSGRVIEDVDRLGHYLYRRLQGWTPKAATEDVNRALFDYSKESLSPFERSTLSRVVFFYNYTRGVIPFVFASAMEDPKKIKQILQLGIQPGKPDFVPSYAGGLNVPTGQDEDGNAQMIYSMGTPVEAALEPFSRGLGGMLSSLNPILRTPLEAATGQDFFFQKPIEESRKAPHYVKDLPADVQALLGVQAIPRKDGQVSYEMDPWALWALRNTPASRISNTLSRGADDRKGAGDKALNLLTGTRMVSIDEEKEMEWRRKDKIKARLKELEREGKVYSPEIFVKNKEADGTGKGSEVDLLMAALRGK